MDLRIEGVLPVREEEVVARRRPVLPLHEEAGEVDVQVRRGQEQRSLPLDGAVEATAELWATLP